MEKSLKIYVTLILVLSLSSALYVLLPQGNLVPSQLPAPKLVLAVVNFVVMFVLYGGLGFLGLTLSARIGFPALWDEKISNIQRFLIPLILGVSIGILLIVLDVGFSTINTVGRLPHPPFPTSVVASVSAGIGEEVIFRLFFIPSFTWLISSVLLKNRSKNAVFWVAALVSTLLFSLGHFPPVLILLGIPSLSSVPVSLIAEILIMNSVLSLVAAYYLRKYGVLAPIGIHFWADVLWHVIYGL